MGMGGAFTAVADDANAAFYNPAGLAINPAFDITGSILLNNRNESVGDNTFAMKWCFDAELDPLSWIVGIGAISVLALEGAKYLSDQGVVQKNWGRSDETTDISEPISEKVLESGTEKTKDVAQQAKSVAKKSVNDALTAASQAVGKIGNSISSGRVSVAVGDTYWGPYRYPYYHYHNNRPTYWDTNSGKNSAMKGKAQMAMGLSLLYDKNAIKDQDTMFYTLTLASGYEEKVALGGNINFYDIFIPSAKLKGIGGGLDLGLLIRPTERISFGIAAKEILTTDIRFDNRANIRLPMTVNAGVAIRPINNVTLAFDIDNALQQSNSPQTFHYGLEVLPLPGFALRAGLYDKSKTAGASLMIDPIIIDYAYLGGEFNRTQTGAVTWKF